MRRLMRASDYWLLIASRKRFGIDKMEINSPDFALINAAVNWIIRETFPLVHSTAISEWRATCWASVSSSSHGKFALFIHFSVSSSAIEETFPIYINNLAFLKLSVRKKGKQKRKIPRETKELLDPQNAHDCTRLEPRGENFSMIV